MVCVQYPLFIKKSWQENSLYEDDTSMRSFLYRINYKGWKKTGDMKLFQTKRNLK